jgi:hypothetical protein
MARSERRGVRVRSVHGLDGGGLTRGIIGTALMVVVCDRQRRRMGRRGPRSSWVLAGLFDFCVITGLSDGIWSGREVRARGTHGGAARTA